VTFKVFLIFAATGLFEPGGILLIPANGFPETAAEIPTGFPPELPLQFCAVEGIAAIMGGTIGNKFQQALGLFQRTEDFPRNADVLQLASAADVVDLTFLSVPQYQVYRPAVVGDMNPVADVSSVAVNGQRLAGQRLRNHKGDKFFRELKRTVVVGATRDDGWKTVRLDRGEYQEIGRCFARGVRAGGRKRRRLRRSFSGPKASIDFIRAHVNKAAYMTGTARIYQPPGSLDVRPYKRCGVLDAPVDVAFGSEVNSRIAVFRDFGHGRVRNIQADELYPGILQRPFQVAQVPRVGELVEDKDLIRRVIPQELVDKIGADESSATGYENAHG